MINTQTTQTYQDGDKITILASNLGYSTIKRILTVKGPDKNGWYGCVTKRNDIPRPISPNALAFRGDTIPYKIDSECDVYASNGCINIVSTQEPEEIRTWLKQNNINPYFTNWKNILLCRDTHTRLNSIYQPLFTE